MVFDRPISEDMRALTVLINRIDDQAVADEGIDKILGRLGIDEQSLGHLAAQRAMRAMGVTTLGEIQARQQEFVCLASVWHEAFVMGVWWSSWDEASKG